MNVEALQRLRAIMLTLAEAEKAPAPPFFLDLNMGSWGKANECGTAACAAGHASLDPWFQSQGFCMALWENFNWTPIRSARELVKLGFNRAADISVLYAEPETRSAERPFGVDPEQDFEACGRFFELGRYDTARLFNPGTYLGDLDNPALVAQRIADLLKGAGHPIDLPPG
jgi:hypothetical protein